ncbi:hypothetical protein [Pseudochryseolinea flava]|uniref:Uncharacterized protein n=1 Tax=Pseudochryseolinea flava TaxID=2059302 RepID=A0A364XUY3_9BACT|nr:hypothetical protein [Pseudochryseolinea flava]RAV98077.1 hypothetical protein DQQ10_25425 [Pseudochryseolinea flava]
MVEKNAITFIAYKNDSPFTVQLEPEAIMLTVNPGEELTFVAKNVLHEFSWAIRYADSGIQLFPETFDYGRIEVFRNGTPSTELDFLYE